AYRQWHTATQFGGGGVLECLEPSQLVCVVRVSRFATVGDVHRPHTHSTACRPDRARLDAALPFDTLSQARGDVVHTCPGQQRNPVPCTLAERGDLVAEAGQLQARESLGRDLRLLQADDVWSHPL